MYTYYMYLYVYNLPVLPYQYIILYEYIYAAAGGVVSQSVYYVYIIYNVYTITV